MRITCPNCNATGNIPEHEVPEEGRFLSCPKCKHGFTVQKPRAGSDAYLVDSCPACAFSTVGEERFSTCPMCGVIVKTHIERQREEQARAHDQELLTKKYTSNDSPAAPEAESSPVAEFVDNLHPVTLVGWGCALAASIILAIGLWGLIEYNPAEIQAQLTSQLEEPVSGWYVFSHHGLMPWIETLYGGTALMAALFFIQHKLFSLRLLSWVLLAVLAFIPLYQVVNFIIWIQEPIPHSLLGYFVEIINILFMTALWGIPIFLLHRFLGDKRVTSVVRL
jgi:predicted Zn finger-like uncharacterized protein